MYAMVHQTFHFSMQFKFYRWQITGKTATSFVGKRCSNCCLCTKDTDDCIALAQRTICTYVCTSLASYPRHWFIFQQQNKSLKCRFMNSYLSFHCGTFCHAIVESQVYSKKGFAVSGVYTQQNILYSTATENLVCSVLGIIHGRHEKSCS